MSINSIALPLKKNRGHHMHPHDKAGALIHDHADQQPCNTNEQDP
jgi:hypothetical protein